MREKTNIETVSIAVLTHPKQERDLLVRYRDTSWTVFLAAFDAEARQELKDTIFKEIPVPSGVAGTEGENAHRARVFEEAAAERDRLGADSGDLETADDRAGQTGDDVTGLKGEITRVEGLRRANKERATLRLRTEPKSTELTAAIRSRRTVQVVVAAGEAVAALGGAISFAGIGEGPAGTDTLAQWVTALGIWFAMSLGMCGLTFGIAKAIRRIRSDGLNPKIVAGLGVAGVMVLVVGFAVMRWIGSTAGEDAEIDAAKLGALALVVVLTIGSLALSVLVASLEEAIAALSETRAVVRRHEDYDVKEDERLAEVLADLQDKLAVIQNDQRRPAQLRDAFRDAVSFTRYRMARLEEELAARRTRIQGTFMLLSGLSGPERESAINRLYTLIPADGVDVPPDDTVAALRVVGGGAK